MKTKWIIISVLIVLVCNIPLFSIENDEKNYSKFETYFEYNKAKQKQGKNVDQIMLGYLDKANSGLTRWWKRGEEIKFNYIKLLNPTKEEFEEMQYESHRNRNEYDFTDAGKAGFRSRLIEAFALTGYAYPAKYDENLYNFLIYIVENEPCIKLANKYLDSIKLYAWNGHEGAKYYLQNKLNDTNQNLRFQIHLHAINLSFGKNLRSYEFLKNQIIQAQDIETTDVAFYSPIESMIFNWVGGIQVRRYDNDQEYDDILELIGLLMKSKCKGIQDYVNIQFVGLIPPNEIEKRISELWNIINDPSYSRREYLDAFYELTAYKMLNVSRYPAQYKPDLQWQKMSIYLEELANPFIITGEPIVYDLENSEIKEDRISREERIYFYERARFYPYNQKVDHEKYKLDEPLFRKIGGE